MKLAWKEIQHQMKKYLLVELLLVLMIFMVIFLSGLANGLARAVSASIEEMDANYFLLAEGSESMLSLSSVGNDDYKNLSDETKAGLNLQRGNITKSDNEDKLDLTYMAINPEGILNPDNTLTTKENTIVLDNSFQSEGIKVGDIVKDSKTEKELEVTGFVSDALYGHVAVGYISTKTYQNMVGSDDNTWAYNAIAIQSDSKPTTTPQHFEWVSKEELVEHIPGYSAEQTTIRMILWVLVVVSAAILGVFFYILTLQKKKQFGVLKAIGMKMSEISNMQISQILILSVTGVLAGNLLSYGLSLSLPAAMPFYLKASDVCLVSIAFIGIALLFGLISLLQIAKIDPISIIGGGDE